MKGNIAFKCTYCNGGKDKENFGYKGICNDYVMEYNMLNGEPWCTNHNCKCALYILGEADLDEDEMVCYESKMLIDWKAYAGFSLYGTKQEEARSIKNASVGKIALLTTVLPNEKESERRIFGIFKIGEIAQYNKDYSGYVKAHEKYRIALKPRDNMYFWNYHRNENRPDECRWSSGLFRYIYDYEIAQILRDLVVKKQNTEDEGLAKELLDNFCRNSGINILEVPNPSGARVK